MPSLTTPPTTDPAQLLRFRDRQYAAELITAAFLHLDLFTWLSENDTATTEDLLSHFDLSPRPADVLLTLCRASGLLETENDRHRLTPLAREHLVAGSPWYLGPYYEPIRETPVVEDFLEILRTGKPANWQAREDAADWHESMLDVHFAQGFTALMNCRGLALGQALAKSLTPDLENRSHLLDIGGGSGIYASTMVAANPHLSATVLEQPPVDTIATEEIASHDLAGKIQVHPANMFTDPWPEGADILLLSNVLHDWDFPEVRTLLEKSHAALPSGGLLIIHEAFLNDDKTGPLPVAEYSALLMNITQGKCYTPKEYGDILEELNFQVGPYQDTIADRGYITATKN